MIASIDYIHSRDTFIKGARFLVPGVSPYKMEDSLHVKKNANKMEGRNSVPPIESYAVESSSPGIVKAVTQQMQTGIFFFNHVIVEFHSCCVYVR